MCFQFYCSVKLLTFAFFFVVVAIMFLMIHFVLCTSRNRFQMSDGLYFFSLSGSGESRSLMKELSHLVAKKQEKFGNLKLMVLHRNTEKMLADAIGATEGVTILCYHHSLPYKYQGRLRAQNILDSAHFLMLRAPEQLPLESLETPEDLEAFLQSTDKALLLVEFCGWAPLLLAKGKNNEPVNSFGKLIHFIVLFFFWYLLISFACIFLILEYLLLLLSNVGHSTASS